MANGHNLIVVYDLHEPTKNYEVLIAEIKTLGSWAKVNKSVWFLDSKLTASQARDRLKEKIDKNDSLAVFDTVDNMGAWSNLSTSVSDHMKKRWNGR